MSSAPCYRSYSLLNAIIGCYLRKHDLYAICWCESNGIDLFLSPNRLICDSRGQPNVWKLLQDSDDCKACFHQCEILCEGVSQNQETLDHKVSLLPKQVLGPPLKSTYPAPGRAFFMSSPLSHLCGLYTLGSGP